MARLPTYILMEDHVIPMGVMDSLTLTAGLFLCPIEPQYVPKHIKEDPRNRWFDPERERYCYTRHGIVAVPRNKIRSV